MITNWSEIKTNDKVYILIPHYDVDLDLIEYKYQESYIINIKEHDDGITIKFKYTNNKGLRKRCFMFISDNRYDVKTLSVNKYHFAMKPYKFGDILISISEDNLKYTYKDLISIKQKDVEKQINKQRQYLEKLEKLKNKF